MRCQFAFFSIRTSRPSFILFGMFTEGNFLNWHRVELTYLRMMFKPRWRQNFYARFNSENLRLGHSSSCFLTSNFNFDLDFLFVIILVHLPFFLLKCFARSPARPIFLPSSIGRVKYAFVYDSVKAQ